MKSKQKWISCYFYYSTPAEFFLIKCIKPVVSFLFKNNKISAFFFIRYFENGHHIRLRLKSSQENSEDIKLYLLNTFDVYLLKNSVFEKKNKSLYNNYVRFVEYEPEIERYGGPKAILIAEEQFEISSKIIIEIMIRGKWSYDEALGKALILHLSFIYSFKFDLAEGIDFFKFNCDNWIPNSFGDSNFAKSLFETEFQKNKDYLLSITRSLWVALEAKVTFEDNWMNVWRIEMERISKKLNKILKKDHPNFLYVLDSFVHMSNNRLGIENKDEPFISYLLYRSLQSIESS